MRPHGTGRREWRGNTEMDPVKRVGGLDWIHLSQEKDSCEYDNEPLIMKRGGVCLI